MLDLLAGLPDGVRPVLACPDGPLADRARGAQTPVRPIRGTDGSLRLHPLHTARALADMTAAAIDVRRLIRTTRADLVHANSIRAGIIAAMARRPGDPPLVVHVRDRLPPGKLSVLSLETIARRADALVANSRYSAEGLPTGARRAPTRVIANPVDLERFDPACVSRSVARTRFGIEAAEMVIAVIAQITPWKAQDDAIRCLAQLRARGLSVRLLVVGAPTFTSRATRFDNRGFFCDLHALRDELDVRAHVDFTGFVEEVPLVLGAVDVLLVPSWEEPFGRTVIEGMAMGVPVIATDVGGPAEIVSDGVDGLLLPPRRPELWADRAAALLEDPALRERLGRTGRRTAIESYGRERHVTAILEVYDELAQTNGVGTADSPPASAPAGRVTRRMAPSARAIARKGKLSPPGRLVRITAASAADFVRGYRFGKGLPPPAEAPPLRPAAANPLEAYYDAQGEGPGLWKWRHYFEIYDHHLSKFRGEAAKMVEIGVLGGGSLLMWRDYLGPASRVYGVDIDPSCARPAAEGIEVFIGDQSDPAFWARFVSEVGPIDIVLDDGGHEAHQQIPTLEALLPHLRPGGVYICEDVIGPFHAFHAYVDGLARALHATSATGDPTAPTGLQQHVGSVHRYPLMTVIERPSGPLPPFEAPKRGSEWPVGFEG